MSIYSMIVVGLPQVVGAFSAGVIAGNDWRAVGDWRRGRGDAWIRLVAVQEISRTEGALEAAEC
jgi:hypothetical protein